MSFRAWPTLLFIAWVILAELHVNFALKHTRPVLKSQCPTLCVCDGLERFVICSEKNLVHIPMPLPDGTILLALPKNEFTSLSDGSFKDVLINNTLESLILYDNKISKIGPNSFRDLGNLKNMWLFGNHLKELKANTFSGLVKLEDLDLSRNQLSTIQPQAFLGLKSLKVLHLWGNSLVTLEANSLLGLENLRNLTLGDNKLKEVPSEAFQSLSNLTSLEILNLPVTTLEAKAFQHLRKLHKLHIGDWPLLERIDDDAFAGLPVLEYLSLYRCNLERIPRTSFSQIATLKELLLSNNPRITSLNVEDFHDLHNLEHLYLSNIGLHSMHESPFTMLTKLENLDLSVNKLSTLPSHIFLQLENLKALNLSYNHLQVLSPSVFISLSKLNVIDLSHNSLICDCDIKWLKSLQELKIREHFTLKGKCSDPLKYNGTEIVFLPPRKFICEAPKFADNQRKITVKAKKGSETWLPCSPEHGVPSPSAEWLFPHQSTKKHSKKLLNGSIFIKSVQSEDYGDYTCHVINKYGEASAKVILEESFHKDYSGSSSHSSSTATGILISLGVVLSLSAVVFYIYKKQWCVFNRPKLLYDTIIGGDEGQRFPMKNNLKCS